MNIIHVIIIIIANIIIIILLLKPGESSTWIIGTFLKYSISPSNIPSVGLIPKPKMTGRVREATRGDCLSIIGVTDEVYYVQDF